MNMQDHKIFWPSVFVLMVYPIFLITCAVIFSQYYSPGYVELAYFLIGYYITNISVGVGLHRLWSHDSFKTNKFVELMLMFLCAGTLQGPVIIWASNHFKHHTYTDKEQDPHSPLKFKGNKIKGFLWSHIGWMLFTKTYTQHIDSVTMKKLGRKKILIWQLKHYWSVAIFMQVIPPLLLGYIVSGSLIGTISCFLFLGLGRALQQAVTFFVNSACHFWGTRKYSTTTARDVWWLALLLLGENWHNFHHAFPSDYRNGFKWYQFDVHKWIIFAMYKLGLAWDLNCTSDVRIQAKEKTTAQNLLGNMEEFQCFSRLCEDVRSKLTAAIEAIEKKSTKLQNNISIKVSQNLNDLSQKVDLVVLEIKNIKTSSEKSAKKLLNQASTKLHNLQERLESILITNNLTSL